MYLVATVVCSTYLFISLAAMWIGIFTLMLAVSAWLIYQYLRKMRFTPVASLAESANLLLVLICLFQKTGIAFSSTSFRLKHLQMPPYT
jgi:hypothetical protein